MTQYPYRYARGSSHIWLASALAAIGLLPLGICAAALSAMSRRGASGGLVVVVVGFTAVSVGLLAMAWRFFAVNDEFRRVGPWCGVTVHDDSIEAVEFDGFRMRSRRVDRATITSAQHRRANGGEQLRLMTNGAVVWITLDRLAPADRQALLEQLGVDARG